MSEQTRRLRAAIGAMALFFTPTLATGDGTPDHGHVALGKMRTALGGQDRLDGLRSLILSGTLRRRTDTEDVTGTIRLEFLLPSHFQKIRSEGGVGTTIPMVRSWGFDGQKPWSAFNGTPTTEVEDSEGELARFLLLLAGRGPTADSISVKYAGEAQAPDGTAHAVDVSGPRIGAARLYIDTATSTPLLLAYEGRLLAGGVTFAMGDGGRVRTVTDKASVSEKRLIEVRPADYRKVSGLLLPHTLSISVGGELVEEWVVEYKVNPPLKPEQFRP